MSEKQAVTKRRDPILTKEREANRKKQALNFMKRIEGDKAAMSMFIDHLKQDEWLEHNEARLRHISAFDQSYVRN